jgi:hypothetical protein
LNVRIEVLAVPGCRDAPLAERLLRRALDEIGLGDIGFETRVINDQAEAELIGFTGSPTFLINGRDPFAEHGAVVGLTCRLYHTPAGHLAGLPNYDALQQALLSELHSELAS